MIRQHVAICIFFAVAILFPSRLLGSDISLYAIIKGQEFYQTNDSTPIIRDQFSFQCLVDSTAPDLITEASVQLPSGGSRILISEDPEEYAFEDTFSSKSALDAAYGAGSYTLNIDSEEDGFNFAQLTMTADNYPSTPQITNYTAAQAINPDSAFTLGWLPFAGGTTNDFVQLELQSSTGEEIYFSGNPGAPDSLNGTNTFFVIPANSFSSGETFSARLNFFKFVSVNTTSIPNARGFVAFKKGTEFSLQTTGAPSAITLQPIGFINGNFQFSFSARPGKSYQIQFANTLPNWENLSFTNAASSEIVVTDAFINSTPARFYQVIEVQ